MAIEKTEKIWHNGTLIPWDDARIHVMSHVIHYGSSVFEGVRCYAPPAGPAIFRAQEHAQRLLDSAKGRLVSNRSIKRTSTVRVTLGQLGVQFLRSLIVSGEKL